ncbi:hypothetical protein PG985_010404 [Apiospora marii]|uniref:uncharacterized protein n=1 Tax=Apiospora marii TaxID=335849 RepID=UPI00312F2D23
MRRLDGLEVPLLASSPWKAPMTQVFDGEVDAVQPLEASVRPWRMVLEPNFPDVPRLASALLDLYAAVVDKKLGPEHCGLVGAIAGALEEADRAPMGAALLAVETVLASLQETGPGGGVGGTLPAVQRVAADDADFFAAAAGGGSGALTQPRDAGHDRSRPPGRRNAAACLDGEGGAALPDVAARGGRGGRGHE